MQSPSPAGASIVLPLLYCVTPQGSGRPKGAFYKGVGGVETPNPSPPEPGHGTTILREAGEIDREVPRAPFPTAKLQFQNCSPVIQSFESVRPPSSCRSLPPSRRLSSRFPELNFPLPPEVLPSWKRVLGLFGVLSPLFLMQILVGPPLGRYA